METVQIPTVQAPAAVTEDPEKAASSEEKEEEPKTDKKETDKEETETEKQETEETDKVKTEETANPLLKTIGIAAAVPAVLAAAVVLVLRLRADRDSEE